MWNKVNCKMERTKKAFCPVCGKDLGSKQLDISEHTVNLACPRCHQRLIIVHGNGKLKVIDQHRK